MRKLVDWLSSSFTLSFITFLGGLIVSLVAQALFGQILPVTQGLLIGVTSLFVVFASLVITSIYQRTKINLDALGLRSKTFITDNTDEGDKEIYEPLFNSISRAKKSLKVVSRQRSSSLSSSMARKRYYENLEKLLRKKRESNENFTFERILQVSDVRDKMLYVDQVDKNTFEHCKFLMELSNSTIKVRLSQIPSVLSTVDFMIIDDHEVYFFIPSVKSANNNQLEVSKLGTAAYFHDPDRRLVDGMERLFDDLQLYSTPIVSLETT